MAFPEKWTSADLASALYRRHRDWVVFKELRIGCGFNGGNELSIDVWAIKPAASSGCPAISYEIKISRGDFLRDLKSPLKQRGARLFSDQFFYVAPPGMIKPEEVPDWAGLMEPYKPEYWENWKSLKTMVPAPFRSKEMPSWPLVVSMMRREVIQVSEDAIPEPADANG